MGREFQGTNFKGERTSTATLRRRKSGRLKREENRNKQTVRDEDVVCRFPLCPCRLFNLFLEVSHQEHKGMGGDPTGERSLPEKMILVCNWRHRESIWSIDKETLRWVALSPAGSRGPVAWEAKIDDAWQEIAREVAPGELQAVDGATDGRFVRALAAELRAKFG